MYTVNIAPEFNGYDSEQVSPHHFGANMLFHSDLLSPGSDFNHLVQTLNVTSIRYPGGTIAEQFFSLTEPNSTIAENYFDVLSGSTNIGTRTVRPLSEYLEYIHGINGTPTIVMPTYRYFDAFTGRLADGAAEEIASFVRNLMLGEYGPATGVILEVGNEWYQQAFEWTVEEYGALQAEIAQIVISEAVALGVRENVSILVQAGRTAEENEDLASFFGGPQSTQVDGVTTHLYGANSNGNTLGIGGGIGDRLAEINSVWSTVLGDGFDLAVTEWNIGESGEATTQINGTMRTAPLLRIFSEMLMANVDIAHVWSTQTLGPAGLSSREGEGHELSPTGYLFNLLQESVIGTRLIDTGVSMSLRDQLGETVGYTYSFEGESHSVFYFVSGVDSPINLTADLSAFYGADVFVYATTLTAAPGDSGLDYRSEASILIQTGISLDAYSQGSWLFSTELGAYDMVQLHVAYGTGVNIQADLQNEIDDELGGSNYSDTLAGYLGNDVIYGSAGDDLLTGGEGSDEIRGGEDNDTIIGDSGNDSLFGEHGRDILDGGSGDDELHGGNWHDTLVGGSGNDSLYGGSGNDEVRPGEGSGFADGGLGMDVLSFSDLQQAVSVWGAQNVAEIGMGILEFDSFEAVEGSPYDDRFTIENDQMTFRGIEGDDSFIFISGAGNRIEMGSGDDTIFLHGGAESEVYGGDGDDFFFVNSSGNTLAGEAGDDAILLANDGTDNIVFSFGGGNDSVSGFDSSTDVITLMDLEPSDVTISETVDGTSIVLSDGSQILLSGVLGVEAYTFLIFA